MVYFWLSAFVFFIIVEAVTPAFISLWFAGGALVSLILAAFSVSPWIQVAAFFVSSALLLWLTRPLYKKYIKKRIVPTNLDTLIGETAIVTAPINNVKYEGEAKVKGKLWAAMTDDGSTAEIGEELTVVQISGVHLILTRKR